MKKLLIVMLVPFLVLGVMGCNNDPTTGSEADFQLQGEWKYDHTDALPTAAGSLFPAAKTPLLASVGSGDFVKLVITANEVTLQFQGLSFPYRAEFAYTYGSYASADGRYFNVGGTNVTTANIFDAFGYSASTPFSNFKTTAATFVADKGTIANYLDTLGAANPLNRVILNRVSLFDYDTNDAVATIDVIAVLQGIAAANAIVVFDVQLSGDAQAWYLNRKVLPFVGQYDRQ
jgi:hypothetical protein